MWMVGLLVDVVVVVKVPDWPVVAVQVVVQVTVAFTVYRELGLPSWLVVV
jgi:hypothetical protein